MKKNEQLFNIIGEIPEELLEDARNSKVVKAKLINWKSILSVAAAFIAICTVPAAIMFVNKKSGYNDVVPNSTVATETAKVTEVTEDSIAEDINDPPVSENALSFGTGPKRADNYKPDRYYSYCDVDEYDFPDRTDPESISIENKLREILVDQDLAEQIITDVKEEAEKLIKESGKDTDKMYASYYINDIINGYVRISISVESEQTGILYDLVEGKMLENYSDMFYYGEDYLSVISSYLAENFFTLDTSKPINGGPDYMIVSGNSSRGYVETEFVPMTPQLYDVIVTGCYRDLSGVIKEGYYSDEPWDEWYYGGININFNGYDVQCGIKTSKFHTEEEIIEHNEDIINIYKDFITSSSNISLIKNYKDCVISSPQYIHTDNNTNCVEIFIRTEGSSERYMFDKENKTIIDGNVLCPEWKDYIDSYYENSSETYSTMETPVTDETINPDDFIVENWIWSNSYYIPENDKPEGITGKHVYLSDEEIDSLDIAAFIYNLLNPETGEKLSALVITPLDKINEVYYNYEFGTEGYSNRIRSWAR